ncbi:MAG TPA: DNA-binding response regulator [Lachnospiraceae bacterium]|nr:DNA-binding response regulator [Lachnospiraceae bacterium]
MVYHILICDDEKEIVQALEIYLKGPDIDILTAYNGQEAVDLVKSRTIHLILMDIMMPVKDGISAMKEIRAFSNVPIILLTAKSQDEDMISGLDQGADDYITKPFNPDEVKARVRSSLRRYIQLSGSDSAAGRSLIQVGGIRLDDEAKSVTVDGQAVSLTRTEYEILKLLMSQPGKVFSSKEIYADVWKDNPFGAENTVAVHIRHLREKMEIDPARPRYLKVVWGQGYKIEGNQ